MAVCRRFVAELPVKVLKAEGYFCSMFESQGTLTAHFLAEDYDTDIDHKLDEMRVHRSRVNFVNKVVPVGIDGKLQLQVSHTPKVYMPFSKEAAVISQTGDVYTITLPEKCAYAIVEIKK